MVLDYLCLHKIPLLLKNISVQSKVNTADREKLDITVLGKVNFSSSKPIDLKDPHLSGSLLSIEHLVDKKSIVLVSHTGPGN